MSTKHTDTDEEQVEAKIHKTKTGGYYGTPEISSILAGFEADIISLHNSRLSYKSGSKAYERRLDQARLDAATRMMQRDERIKQETVSAFAKSFHTRTWLGADEPHNTGDSHRYGQYLGYNDCIKEIKGKAEFNKQPK